MQIAIVAEKPSYNSRLQFELRHCHLCAEYRYFDTAGMFLRILRHRTFDLVFLAAELPDESSLSVCEKLRNVCPDCMVVFVAGCAENRLAVCGINVLALIDINHLAEDVPVLLRKLRAEYLRRQNIVVRTAGRRLVRIPLTKFRYACIYGRHVILYTDEKQIVLIKESLKDVYRKFPENSCIYISRSCFVNTARIGSIDHRRLYLDNGGKSFEISRGRYAYVKQAVYGSD